LVPYHGGEHGCGGRPAGNSWKRVTDWDVESQYDYFGARYYDARIGRFLSADPHARLYPALTPYAFVGDNPLTFVDPTGRDSTFYISQETNTASVTQLQKSAGQVGAVLKQNEVPMTVKFIPYGANIAGVVGSDPDEQGVPRTLTVVLRPILLDDTDVQILVSDDTNPSLRERKESGEVGPNTEGISVVGSKEGLVTADALNRNGLTEIGFGNIIVHEGLHGAGLPDTYRRGSLMAKSKTPEEVNRPTQSLTQSEARYIREQFLKGGKKEREE
jgi:RHS repeat-associated protein